MKKILWIIILGAILAFGLHYAYHQEQQDIQGAKQDLGIVSNIPTQRDTTNQTQSTGDDQIGDTKEEKEALMLIEHISGTEVLSFDPVNDTLITHSDALDLSGKVEGTVGSIVVDFTNSTSDFPDDSYTLTKFQEGDTRFLYRAHSKYQVFDYGVNEYTFTAKTSEGESITKVFITKQKEVKSGEKEELILGTQDDIISLDLPSSSSYGEPMKLGESSLTYTGIKGIEIVRESGISFESCETLTDFLGKRIQVWYYWNTCRPIGDSAFKYNVLRLDGDDYIYERHYIDLKKSLYMTYQLERGQGVNSENIAEKNTQLKERSFPNGDISDILMSDIIKS